MSPRLYSRSSTSEYGKALETAENVVLTPHGPVRRRNGTKFIAEVKDSSAEVRLVRYQFSTTQAFILEFGNQYIRFFKDQGQVVETALNITGITQANPGVITSASHNLSNDDQVYITGIVGMTELNNSTLPYVVKNSTTNTFTLEDLQGNAIDTTSYTAYSSGGTIQRIYEITSPYTTAQVDDINYVQFGTALYIVHPDVSPRKLTRSSDTSWTIEEVEFLPPPTYESGYESTGVTVTPGNTTGTGITFTASGSIFLPGDEGRQIINNSSGETGRASIVTYNSATSVTCDIVEDFTDTNAIASDDWKMDLSPVVDLTPSGTQAGSVINIRSEYSSGSLGDKQTITNVTKANPGVVTITSHPFIDGDSIQVRDIVGMTQINDKIFTVDNTTANTFELKGENTSGYTTYSSGGIAEKRLTGETKDAFRSADVGKYILINGGVLQVISVNSGSDIDCEVLKSLNNDDSTGNWTLETETWTSSRGYPKAIGLHDQRLVFGGTSNQPQTIWMSEVGIFDGFGTGPDDEDAIEIELVSNEVNQISWIVSSRDLVVGTSGGELTIEGTTPSTVSQKPRTYHGSSVQQVPAIKDEILFIQNSGRKVRTFRYDFNIDGYTGEDLTFVGEHLTEDVVKEIVYAQEPDTVIYGVLETGEMISGTYERSKQIIGWSKMITDGYFENVETISGTSQDEVWTVVKRTINSNTVRYVELLEENDSGTSDLTGFSDSYLSYSVPIAISGVSLANPGVVTTSSAHGLSNGDKVVIKGIEDPLSADLDSDKTNMSDLNRGVYTVANKTSTTFELSGVDTSNYNAWGSGGSVFLQVSTVSGLDHLEGKTVQLKVDGATSSNKTVSSGSITLDSPAGEIVIGLPYTTTVKTLSPEYDIGRGSMQGQQSRWVRPLLRVYQSGLPQVNGEFVPSRNSNDLMDQRVPLYSGFIEYGSLTWSNTASLTITLSDPLPLLLSGIFGTASANVR